MNKQGTIYKIENVINGKVYIGQTIRDVDRRLQVHFAKLDRQYHNNNYLQNAYNKYGKNNFRTTIVEECGLSEIDEKEIEWIRYYKEKNLSYNLEDGGNLRKIVSKETREKLKKSTRETWANNVIRNKRIKNMPRGKDNYNSRKVICLNDMKVFESMTEAGEYYKLSLKQIHQNASGRNPYCYNQDRTKRFAFEYYEEGKEYLNKEHIHGQSISVTCTTTNEVFTSLTGAGKKYSIPTTNISKVCKGQRNHAGALKDGTKLKWEYT